MSARALAKGLLPPLLVDQVRRWTGHCPLRFAGRPADWAEAVRVSSGYGSANILERVTQATRAVVSGAARYERDSVLFNEPEYPFPLLAALLRVAARDRGRLDVVDFGGSLGNTYRQCRPLLEGLSPIRWWVIEQAAFVTSGLAEFTTEELRFAHSLAEVPPNEGQRVILASSVLQYLEDPGATLQAFGDSAAGHLVIDRTPLSLQTADRLCIQHVPKHIYAASYPCWILSRSRLMDRLSHHWRLVCDFPCAEGVARTDDGVAFEFRGLILERKR